MNPAIPAADPVPLPAPVWLLKFLGDLTLTFHFAFLHMLIGGLFLAIAWNILGHARKSPAAIGASGVVIGRLPIVMTYVINLGVPPLLFVQVLYGQALYTGTVLIGAYWISVVFAIIVAYSLLYKASHSAAMKKPFWGWALASLVFVLYVGKIYSTAMTLMLRPEVWGPMYAASDNGILLPPHDPTRTPRFIFMMVASLGFGALGTVLYSAKRSLDEGVKVFLRVWGGRVAAVFFVALAGVGFWAWGTQPEAVRGNLGGQFLTLSLILLWGACLFLSAAVAVWIQASPKSWGYAKAFAVALPAMLAIAAFVAIRDMVRDATLFGKGFDVWQSAVNTNWLIVILFFVSLLIGIAGLLWLLGIVHKAKPSAENYV